MIFDRLVWHQTDFRYRGGVQYVENNLQDICARLFGVADGLHDTAHGQRPDIYQPLISGSIRPRPRSLVALCKT